MIEGFIQARLEAYSYKAIATSLHELENSSRSLIAGAAEKAEQSGPTPPATRTDATPPMLPSPASLGGTNSANSTPTNRDASLPTAITSRPATGTANAASR